jgi:hypothetical protein
MVKKKRLKKNKQRGMYKRIVIRGKKPMTPEQKEARKKAREAQREANIVTNTAK